MRQLRHLILAWRRGLHSTKVAYLPLTQQPQVWFSAFPRIFLLILLRFIGSTAWNTGQMLDNVNRTYLVLASGKLLQQNNGSNIVTGLEMAPRLHLRRELWLRPPCWRIWPLCRRFCWTGSRPAGCVEWFPDGCSTCLNKNKSAVFQYLPKGRRQLMDKSGDQRWRGLRQL